MQHENKYGSLRLKVPGIDSGNRKVCWICDCGRETLLQYTRVVSGLVTSCGKCAVPNDAEFVCTKCKRPHPGREYGWQTVKGKFYRKTVCNGCKSINRREYHKNNREHAKETHAALRERRLSEGGDRALEWWFARHISQWRAKSKRDILPEVDLDVPYMIALFHQQNGLCYYTGVELSINNFGRKHVGWAGPLDGAMSLDRKTPAVGYIKGNVVLCTYWVNTMKGHRTHDEFVAVCETICRRMKGAA
jgi:hypothetical protein